MLLVNQTHVSEAVIGPFGNPWHGRIEGDTLILPNSDTIALAQNMNAYATQYTWYVNFAPPAVTTPQSVIDQGGAFLTDAILFGNVKYYSPNNSSPLQSDWCFPAPMSGKRWAIKVSVTRTSGSATITAGQSMTFTLRVWTTGPFGTANVPDIADVNLINESITLTNPGSPNNSWTWDDLTVSVNVDMVMPRPDGTRALLNLILRGDAEFGGLWTTKKVYEITVSEPGLGLAPVASYAVLRSETDCWKSDQETLKCVYSAVGAVVEFGWKFFTVTISDTTTLKEFEQTWQLLRDGNVMREVWIHSREEQLTGPTRNEYHYESSETGAVAWTVFPDDPPVADPKDLAPVGSQWISVESPNPAILGNQCVCISCRIVEMVSPAAWIPDTDPPQSDVAIVDFNDGALYVTSPGASVATPTAGFLPASFETTNNVFASWNPRTDELLVAGTSTPVAVGWV